jgi:N-acetylneuraminic acid mutarotase
MMRLAFIVFAAALLGRFAIGQKLNWREQADLPRPVAGYMAGVVHGKFLLAGGSYWENSQKHWSKLVQAFDPARNTWTHLTPLPAPRSDAASATLDDDFYCFGGGSGDAVLNDAIVLHNGQWSPVPDADLPAPRLFAVAVSSRGWIYLLGGIPRAGNYKTMSNELWRWQPGRNKWEVLQPLPGPGRISFGMGVIDGNIYVLGGATTGAQDVENLQDAYRYDTVKGTWTRLPDLPVANRAWWAVGIGHRALVLGGYTDQYVGTSYWYDPAHSLTPAEPLPHALADAKFFQIGNIVIGTGGEAGPGIRGKWTLAAKVRASTTGRQTKERH